MWVKNLFASNFRNFARLDLEFSPRLNLFWGDNGEGKTNLLESLYFLGHGKSFRTKSDEELIKWGESGLYLKGEGVKSERFFTYEIVLDRKISKLRKIDSHRVGLRNPTKWLWMVTFSPEDIWLVKGSPQQRRDFLDAKLPLVNFRYSYLRSSYLKVLSQRNHLFSLNKTSKTINQQLDIWDGQLVKLGSKIVKLRLELLEKLEFFFRENYPRVMGQNSKTGLIYRSSFLKDPTPGVSEEEITRIFQKELKLRRKKELELETTLIGPHRDDFLILADGVDLRVFGSQGEQRIATLSLKLAELGLVSLREGERPVTLLDDVASELDPKRQKLLLDLVRQQSQVFITTTNLSWFEPSFTEDGWLYQVKNNMVKRN
ncbi:MAG: DNA replication/repair protein RecF [bacterium]